MSHPVPFAMAMSPLDSSHVPLAPSSPIHSFKGDNKGTVAYPSHVRREFNKKPADYTGDLVRLLDDIATQTHGIAAYIKEQDEIMQYGRVGAKAISPDFATRHMYKALSFDGYACLINARNREVPLVFPDDVPHGNYVVCLSPLDADPVTNYQEACGTLFSIYKRKSATSMAGRYVDLQQACKDQVAAGVIRYGTATVLTYTMNSGVFSFSLHPVACQFFLNPRHPVSILSAPPLDGLAIYGSRAILKSPTPLGKGLAAFSAANTAKWISPGGVAVAALSALAQGAIFVSVGLDLLCEAGPLALIFEQAGAACVDANGKRILDLAVTEDFRVQTAVVAGRKEVVEEVMSAVRAQGAVKK